MPRGGAVNSQLPEHVVANRQYWDSMADDWVAPGERAWGQAEPTWGVWPVPESDLSMLPPDMSGMDAIELGCGTAYVAAWMARRGARVTGIDNSERQLATARRLAHEHGIALTLIHGSAEEVPLPAGSVDFAISEYGAAIWCDPYIWIPEAHRLLRPGGRLVFLGNSPISSVCSPLDGAPVDDRLHRDYFGLHRLDWRQVTIDPGGVEFSLTFSEWLRLFRRTGFDVLDYLEVQAPEHAPENRFNASVAWARRFPLEHVWKLRKAG